MEKENIFPCSNRVTEHTWKFGRKEKLCGNMTMKCNLNDRHYQCINSFYTCWYGENQFHQCHLTI